MGCSPSKEKLMSSYYKNPNWTDQAGLVAVIIMIVGFIAVLPACAVGETAAIITLAVALSALAFCGVCAIIDFLFY